MKPNQACVLAMTSLLPFSTLWLHAADSTVTTTTVQSTSGAQSAQMESVKRQQLIFSASQAISDGQRLLHSGKYDEAADRFQYALDALTNGGVSEALYERAEAGLATAKAWQAHELAKDNKFAQAADRLREAVNLQPNNPTYPRLLEDLKRQQIAYEEQVRDPEGTVNNPAVTEDLKRKVATVQKLLFQGDDYFRTGQYEKAEDTYSKILILDPYNNAARSKMDHIEHYKERAAGFRHEQYEQESILKVNQGWAEAISPDVVVPPTASINIAAPSNRASITRKLQSIIIDKVNFDKLDIATVIQFLTQKSKELDPEHIGINFVLRLTTDSSAQAVPTDNTGAASATPAAGGTPAATGTPAAGAAPATPDATAATTNTTAHQIHREVSITLENVPLADILEYIIQQTNLQYTVEDYAVYLRPSIDEGETLTVRTYLVPPNFFTGSSLKVTTTQSTDQQPSTVESISADVQQELSNRGIRFPGGATATFLPGSSKLVVRNTPEQLDLIANLIDQLSKETPQVTIEAKIAEFTQDAIKALTFNYAIGAGFPPAPTITPPGSAGAGTALRTPDYASRTGSGGLQANSIDSLILANSGNGSVFPLPPGSATVVAPNTSNTLTVGAILDGTGLLAVIDAINNMHGVSLLSAPAVTTQNGLKANIDIVREFPYPTSFEKPKLSNNSALAYPGSNSIFFVNNFLTLAIPPTPREFATQDIGVSLEVKPTTYPDQRIDLDITKAEVIDFDGFINYGVPITTRTAEDSATDPRTSPGTVLTEGVINQPVFNIRSMVTNIQVLDGQTAVLGGLIREDTQEINDKVPVLGDLPLVGRLFQSKVSERTKKSLLFFITARLIRSTGKPEYVKTLNAEPMEEELPEPEPIGPGINLPPLSEGTPNS